MALAVVLILLDIVLIVGTVALAAVGYLGMATTVYDLRASGNTPEKAVIAALIAAPLLPWALFVLAAALTAFLCFRFVRATGSTVARPHSDTPQSPPQAEGWKAYAIPRPLGSRGPTAISTTLAPGRTFPLRWGEFQEIKWEQAEVQVRVDHLGLEYRGAGPLPQYAVRLKIIVQTESGSQLNLATGADVVLPGQPNEYITPISQVGLANYSTMPGSIGYIGNPRGHYPDFAAFTMCVRKINRETGEAEIEAFFGGKLQ